MAKHKTHFEDCDVLVVGRGDESQDAAGVYTIRRGVPQDSSKSMGRC